MDKKSRDLVMGKLYLKNKDYKMAEKSFSEYLNSNPEDYQALKMLAQVQEQLNDTAKAFDLYQRCYLTQPDRKGVLLDICRLMLMKDPRLDHVDQKKWFKLAIQTFPTNPIVTSLRESLPNIQGTSPNKINTEDLILEKLTMIRDRFENFEDRLRNIEDKLTDLSIKQSAPLETPTPVPVAVAPAPTPAPLLASSTPPKPPLTVNSFQAKPSLFNFAPKPASVDLFAPKPAPAANTTPPKPAPTVDLPAPRPAIVTTPIFKPSTTANLFGPKPTPPVDLSAPKQAPTLESNKTPKPSSGDIFAPKPTTAVSSLAQPSTSSWTAPTTTTTTTEQPKLNFGQLSFNFASNAPTAATTTTTTNATSDKSAADQDPNAFNFSGVNLFAESLKKFNMPTEGVWNPPAMKKDENNEEEANDDDNEVVKTEELPIENTCDMKPIEIKSGEEDEDIVFKHRCKLFRFRDKEYKERGLGDIKVLKHKETGKGRLIMRRELINLVCLNCWSCTNIERVRDTQVRFAGLDASDGEAEMTVFLAKFKTPELTDDFMKHLTDLFSED